MVHAYILIINKNKNFQNYSEISFIFMYKVAVLYITGVVSFFYYSTYSKSKFFSHSYKHLLVF